MTGMILALNQAGFIGGGEATPDALVPRAATNPDPGNARSGNVEASVPATAPEGSLDVRFPEGTSIRSGDLTYTILEGWTEPNAPPASLLLANFWDASFRLVVDGLLHAPVGGLNEIVDGNSTSEAVVGFIVESTVREAGLQMGVVGNEAPALPVVLAPVADP